MTVAIRTGTNCQSSCTRHRKPTGLTCLMRSHALVQSTGRILPPHSFHWSTNANHHQRSAWKRRLSLIWWWVLRGRLSRSIICGKNDRPSRITRAACCSCPIKDSNLIDMNSYASNRAVRYVPKHPSYVFSTTAAM